MPAEISMVVILFSDVNWTFFRISATVVVNNDAVWIPHKGTEIKKTKHVCILYGYLEDIDL